MGKYFQFSTDQPTVNTETEVDKQRNEIQSKPRRFEPLPPPEPEKPGLIDTVTDAVKNNSMVYKYLYSDADKLEEANKMGTELNIPVNVVLKHRDYVKERWDYYRKMQPLMTDGNEVDMTRFYEKYPEIKAIADMDETEAAIALNYLDDIKKVQEDTGAVEAGWAGWQNMKQQADIVNKARDENRELSEDEWAEIRRLQEEAGNLPEIPTIFEDPYRAVVAGTAMTAPLMLHNYIIGARNRGTPAAGGWMFAQGIANARLREYYKDNPMIRDTTTIAGALLAGGGAKELFIGGMRIGSAEDMFRIISALDYLDYKQRTDKNGNPLPDKSAWAWANAAATVETVIEFGTTEQVLSIIGRMPGGKAVVNEIVKRGLSKDGIKEVAGDFLKTMGEITLNESAEEGLQEVSNMVFQNMAANANPDFDFEKYEIGDLMVGGATAFVQALGPSFGFGVAGAIFNNTRLGRMLARSAKMRKHGMALQAQNNQFVTMLENLDANKKENELYQKKPESYNKAVESRLKDTKFENTYIDTELVKEDEHAEEILNAVAKEAGISEEELAEKVENNEMIKVPTATYNQALMSDDAKRAANNYVTYDPEAMSAERNKRYGEELLRQEEERKAAKEDKKYQVRMNMAQEISEDSAEQAAAFNILANYDDIKEGIKQHRQELIEQQDNILQPIVDVMVEGAGNGSSYLPVEEREGHGVSSITHLPSSNNDLWYRVYMRNHRSLRDVKKGLKGASRNELRSLAAELLNGSDPYGIAEGVYAHNGIGAYLNDRVLSEEELARNMELWNSVGMEYNAETARLENDAIEYNLQQRGIYNAIQEELDALDKVQDKLLAINKYDMMAREDFGDVGYEVYKHYRDIFKNNPSPKSRSAAEESAYLLGRNADIMKNIADEMNTPYTAQDYINHLEINQEEGKKRRKKGKTYNQPAYHGTNREYLEGGRFSTRYMSEGEGGQAHGWGLYFAQGLDVGEGYRNRLTERENEDVRYMYDGEELHPLRDHRMVETIHKIIKEAAQIWRMDNNIPSDKKVVFPKYTSELFAQAKERLVQHEKIKQEFYENARDWHKAAIKAAEKAAATLGYEDTSILHDDFFKKVKRSLAHSKFKNNYQDLDIWERHTITYEKFIDDLETIAERERRTAVDAEDALWDLDNIETEKMATNYTRGSYYQVEIPEDNVLLNEQSDFSFQPRIVREAIKKIFNDVLTVEDWRELANEKTDNEENLEQLKETAFKAFTEGRLKNDWWNPGGKNIYEGIVSHFMKEKDGNRYESKKAASLLLNEYGVKGIKYDGRQDGICYVIFDDDSVKILNRYEQENRGSIDIYEDGTRRMNVFKKADWSTCAHESFHLFLEDWTDIASMPNAPEWVKNDVETLKKHYGWKKNQKYWTNAQQEQFAKDAEAYLMTGKAPSSALVKIFRQFKEWLTKLYDSFKKLGGEAHPEVTAVMDRMLATQQEIDALRSSEQLDAWKEAGGLEFLTNGSQNVYENIVNEIVEKAKEQVLADALNDYRETIGPDREKFESKMRDDIYRDAVAENIVLCINEIAQQNPDVPLENIIHAMDETMTMEQYQEQLKELGGSWQAYVDKKYADTIQAYDDAYWEEQLKARALEAIESGKYNQLFSDYQLAIAQQLAAAQQQLSKDFNLAPAEETATEETTEQTETEEKPAEEKKEKPAKKKATSKQVESLQKNITKSAEQIKQLKERIRETYKGIRLSRDAVVGLHKYMKNQAEELMKSKPISESTDVKKWRELARQNSRENLRLMAKGDFVEAANKKYLENLYGKMAEIADKNSTLVNNLKNRLLKKSNNMEKKVNGKLRSNLPTRERYAFDHLLYIFGITNTDATKPLDYPGFTDLMMESTDRLDSPYVTRDASGNIRLGLPDWVINAGTAEKPLSDNYQTRTVDEFKDLYDLMNNIYKTGMGLNNTKTILDINGKPVLISDAAAQIVEEADENLPDHDDKWDNIAYTESHYHKRLVKPETWFRAMGDKAYNFMYMPLKHAADEKEKRARSNAKILSNLFKDYSFKEQLEIQWRKQYKLGKLNLTKSEVIQLGVYWGTEISRNRIMDGFGVEEEDVLNVLRNLDKRDWDVVRTEWKAYKDLWPEIQKQYERMWGVVLEGQKATPFTIADNKGNIHELDGGYATIMYDYSKSAAVARMNADEALRMQMAEMSRLGMNMNFTKERVKGKVELPLRLDLGVFGRSLDNIAHFLAFAEPVRDVNRLVRSKPIKDLLIRKYGDYVQEMVNGWVLDVWAQEPDVKEGWEKYSKRIRTNTTMSVLGFRLMTAAMNAGNIPALPYYLMQQENKRRAQTNTYIRNGAIVKEKPMKDVGVVWGIARAMAALKNYYLGQNGIDPRKMLMNREFIMSKSVFMQEREASMDRDVRSYLAQNPYKNKFARAAFRLISETDLIIAMPMWLSEYESTMQYCLDIGLSPQLADMHAVDAGDAAVRRMIASGRTVDLAAMQRGSEFEKSVTMYMSYMNTVYNAGEFARLEGRSIRHKGGGLLKSYLPLAYWGLLMVMGNAFFNSIVRHTMKRKDLTPEGYFKEWANETMNLVLGSMPGFRDFADNFTDFLFGTPTYFRTPMTPIIAVIGQIPKTLMAIQNEKKTKADVLRELNVLLGRGVGIPQTFLDALPTTMDWFNEDFSSDISSYIRAILLDQRLHQGEEKPKRRTRRSRRK